MDVAGLISRVREHYVEQFRAFVAENRAKGGRGGAEMKLQLREGSPLFDRMYCADFLNSEHGGRVIEFVPENVLSFACIEGTFGQSALTIDHLRWDDVLVQHDAAELPADKLSVWFRRWFDPDDDRHDAATELSGIVHSMMVGPNSVSIDLGTADPEAFWDMLQLIADAGATHVRISTSREEDDDTPS